ncbi:unnamed protein product [Paramecium sonneborni]|uniref:Uncharacterized protein n=1 Tax=Paramecium sonneborni TaxID=65129 RepID=A0A8S1RRV4_9CILI|nr:unnamed protein product [Paramecium sonneborni]
MVGCWLLDVLDIVLKKDKLKSTFQDQEIQKLSQMIYEKSITTIPKCEPSVFRFSTLKSQCYRLRNLI